MPMIDQETAADMHKLWQETDLGTVCAKYPQFKRFKIQRAISDHVDRLIEQHRKQKV